VIVSTLRIGYYVSKKCYSNGELISLYDARRTNNERSPDTTLPCTQLDAMISTFRHLRSTSGRYGEHSLLRCSGNASRRPSTATICVRRYNVASRSDRRASERWNGRRRCPHNMFLRVLVVITVESRNRNSNHAIGDRPAKSRS